jgi:hypothetical protein
MIADNSSVPAIKAFCVGQAKSGTASLAALLAANHRAAHEPEREQMLEMMSAWVAVARRAPLPRRR